MKREWGKKGLCEWAEGGDFITRKQESERAPTIVLEIIDQRPVLKKRTRRRETKEKGCLGGRNGKEKGVKLDRIRVERRE